MKHWHALAVVLVLSVGPGTNVNAQDNKLSEPAKKVRNAFMKTLGGRQFWGDLHYFHGWRIQQHYATKHYRLLDKDDVRHASGTLDECRGKLEAVKKENKLKPMDGKAAILIHGIVRSSKSFAKLEKRLEAEGYTVFSFDYPSTRITIPESAAYLEQCIKSLEGIDEIHLVVHSMGGLVVRSMLKKVEDPRITRMVMMGVPNMGAEMADTFKTNPLFKAIFGPAGQQLVTNPEVFLKDLPTPKFEFGILAGARGTEKGYNPIIPGDDDGTVAVASTRLPGAKDFVSRPVLHSFLMYNNQCIDCTVRFLKEGRFEADRPARPIAREPTK